MNVPARPSAPVHRRVALAARLATLSLRSDDDEAFDRERDEIRAGMRALERQMRELGLRPDDGGELGAMGRRMRQLSRQADRDLRGLAEEAIRAGRAERVRDPGDL